MLTPVYTKLMSSLGAQLACLALLDQSSTVKRCSTEESLPRDYGQPAQFEGRSEDGRHETSLC